MKRIALFFIKIYQIFISPLLGIHKCRFVPTCSQYTFEAIEKKGALKGCYLGFCRIIKCNPFCKKNGYDPVK